MRHVLIAALLLAQSVLTVAQDSAAQEPIDAAVRRAPDGVVRMTYASRPGACGHDDLVMYRRAMFGGDFEGWGSGDNRCDPGPVRAELTVQGGRPVSVVTMIGGQWRTANTRVTDLGTVSSHDAAAYFLSIVPQLEQAGKSRRILLPAVLAADAPVVAPLMALARDRSRTADTRSQAISWVGLLGDARELMGLREVIEDARERAEVRKTAIFALSHGTAATPADFRYLAQLYPQLAPSLKESVIHGMSQDAENSSRWLLGQVRSAGEPLAVRRSALFWAGQSRHTRTADLVSVYHDAGEANLRDHAIFVLSQRGDDDATTALLDIARRDPDTPMRGKALFWLAQKNDPRVTKLIADLVTAP